MDWFQLVWLPVLQGIAEFLPISSSGHLVIAEALGGRTPNDTYNVLLHGGTLLSIIVFYHRRLWQLLREDRRVIPLLVVGTIPAAVLGVTIEVVADDLLDHVLLAGALLIVTGSLAIWANRRPDGERGYRDLSWREALIVGAAQAAALLPGLSRSGSTIAAGVALGLRRDQATSFSFLLAIPAILGAMVVKGRGLLSGDAPPLTGTQLAGAVVAAVVGLGALSWLHRWVTQQRLHWFGYWCIPFGLAVVVWQLASLWAAR